MSSGIYVCPECLERATQRDATTHDLDNNTIRSYGCINRHVWVIMQKLPPYKDLGSFTIEKYNKIIADKTMTKSLRFSNCRHFSWEWKPKMQRVCIKCRAELEPDLEMVRNHRPYKICGSDTCLQCWDTNDD